MNRNRQKNNFPILRRSVALITTAILLSASAHAEITIPRLSSLGDSGSSESIVPVKPNVFILVDNHESMAHSDTKVYDINGNRLQGITGALIASLPQLENKVRLGFTSVFRGINGFDNAACKDLKINGNVKRLSTVPGFEKLAEDLQKNKNYVTGDEDFIFKNTGSGYGDTTPRDFSGNYARYFYSWLGGMCPGLPANRKDNLPYEYKPLKETLEKDGLPPYADLNDPEAYKEAAKKIVNTNSFPLSNFISLGKFNQGFNPVVDFYSKILGEVGDENFIRTVAGNRCTNGGARCGWVNFALERGARGALALRPFPSALSPLFSYDAYAPTREDNGYPQDKNPVSCRKNFTIMITGDRQMSSPESVGPNALMTGVGGFYASTEPEDKRWEMPNGQVLPRTGKMGEFTRIYRYTPVLGISGKVEPISKGAISGATNGSFIFSKLVLQSYYLDLRGALPNDLPPYTPSKGRKVNGKRIPPFWDRKNDPATWQHMTFFALGVDAPKTFQAWKKASSLYHKNFPHIDVKKEGILEPYFQAVEGGVIYDANKPLYDWARGGYGLTSLGSNQYFYKDPQTKSTEKVTIHPPEGSIGDMMSLIEMDYAKAGMVGRGGAYLVSDYESIKRVVNDIAAQIQKSSSPLIGISGGAVGGGGRITATGGNDSTLFATYLDQSNYSGNIFAFKNCPLLQQSDEKWGEEKCGSRLWDAATILAKSTDIASKTIVPTLEGSNQLVGQSFIWENLDSELKAQFSGSEGEKVGQARVNWLNGTLASSVNDTAVKGKLRERPKVKVPSENNSNGNNANGAVKETTITNLMGEIVYATPKAVDNRGTLPAAHPLNGASYRNFVDNVVSKRAPMVVAGANDGRLYAFNNGSNNNDPNNNSPKDDYSLAFSYIPRHVMTRAKDSLNQYISQDITAGHMGFVNGPFSYRDAFVGGKWGTYLVGTLGTGGGVIYALDISKGTANHPEDVFKWETADKFGTIMTEPRIIWIRNTKKDCGSQDTSCSQGKWVVLVPTGYNADSVSLVILDLENGQELARIDTHSKYRGDKGTGACTLDDAQSGLEKTLNVSKDVSCDNGLGALTVVDADLDGGADYVYAGDLLGHVWKFDLTDFFKTENPGEGVKVAYDGQPIFIAETADGATRQPITAMIEVADGAYGEGSMLYFGTGRLFNLQERGLAQQQSFYGVWDNPRYVNKSDINSDVNKSDINSGARGYNLPLRRTPPSSAIYDFIKYDTFLADRSKIQNNNVLRFFSEIRGVKPKGGASPSSDYLSLGLEENGSNKKGDSFNKGAVGWIIDFSETPKERVIGRAYSFEGSVFFPTFEPKGDTGGVQESCTPIKSEVGGDGRFYMVDRLTGGQLDKSPFDFNGDGQQDNDDNIKEFQPDPRSNGSNSNGSDNGTTGSLPPAAIKLGSTSGNFLSVTGVLSMIEKSKKDHQCDYTRQVIFPGTVDPVHGNPTVFTSCHQNRYRVWKQPIIE